MTRYITEDATFKDNSLHNRTLETPLESTPLGTSLSDLSLAFESSGPAWGRCPRIWILVVLFSLKSLAFNPCTRGMARM